MLNIHGSIGYTVLENPDTKKRIIVLADMHDSLSECSDKTSISDWFKSKFDSSEILLEEVPRENFELQELWGNSAHTQSLKHLFLDNPTKIVPVDIRPFLIPFSWEIINDPSSAPLKVNITLLKDYLEMIDSFFTVKQEYLLKKNPNYILENLKHTIHGKHYIKIKQNYYNFLINHKHLLKISIVQIYHQNIYILEQINDILNDIMEWHICSKILLKKDKSTIVHAGLAHSEKVIEWLINHYNYKSILYNGINQMDKLNFSSPLSGCVYLPTELEIQFGGSIQQQNYGIF